VVSLEEFERVVGEYEWYFELPEEVYLKAVGELRRRDPGGVSEVDVRRYILLFLDTWGRMRRVLKGVDPGELAGAIRGLSGEVSALRGLSLLDADLEGVKVARAVEEVFDRLRRVRNLGPTGASKVAHLLCPDLFVMWDRRIAESYGLRPEGRYYLEFLKKMQGLAREVVEQKALTLGCSVSEAAKKLSEEHGGRTLAKLVDEYNWWKTYRSVVLGPQSREPSP